MGEFAAMFVSTGRMTMGLAEQMLKDVKPEIFARKPSLGGKVIDTNHAAFVYGHLAIYPARCLTFLGLDAKAAAVPGNFEELFAPGKECKDDPAGTIYPPMKVITEAYFAAQRAALEVVGGVDDAKLKQPNPREGRMRELLPTVGAMVNFYLTTHPMMHIGQVSAWRRCFGLGSVMG